MATNKLPALVPQIYEHDRFGKIRVIGDSDNPLFCLSDACKMLGLDASQAIKRLDDGVVSIHPIIDRLGRTQRATFVNEDGLYDLILDSRKPKAREIRKWLTSEVMPSLRKTGMYIDPTAPINPAFLRRMADEIEQRDKQIAALSGQVAELEPKAKYCELILQSNEALPVTVIAKDYGMGAAEFNALLHKLEIQFKTGKVWVLYQIYAGLGYMKTVTKTLQNGLTVTQNYWTQRGRMFLYSVLKKANVLPLVERQNPMATLF